MERLVSVIVPNYNKERYIKECLDSILNQTYSNIEVIVIDDCSSDFSRKIIEEYQKEFTQVKSILLKKNGGVSRARNIGIKAASGFFVTMLDSDDFYYDRNKIKNEVELLESYNGKGIAYSYRQVVDENSKLIYKDKRNEGRYKSGNLFYTLLTEKDAFGFVQRDYVLPKEYIMSVKGYNEYESYYEDFDLLLRLTKKYPMYYTGHDGTAYRLVNDGLSSLQSKNDARQFIIPQKIRNRYIKYLPLRLRIRARIIWVLENIKLRIRIIGRKIKHMILGW